MKLYSALFLVLVSLPLISLEAETTTTSPDLSFLITGDTLFFEDWESGEIGSMWTANSSRETGRIEVVGGAPALNGANGLRMGNAVNNQYNVNTLDLSLPLAAYQGRDLVLEYWIYDNFDQSNTDDLIAISDDGGNTFTNIVNWIPGTWVSQQYGKLPPLDLDEAVRAAGMSFTDQFVIRFQQADDDDFNNDGIYLDDILIREESVVYAPPPFSDQFDNAQLSPAWRWINPQGVTATSPTTPGNLVQVFQGAEYVYSETGALAFGRRFETDNVFSVNAADLHLNLQGYTDAELRFWRKRFYDEEDAEDGIWISDDGGASFEKMYAFATEDFPNLTYQEVVIDLDSTLLALGKALTDRVVVRFQQAGSDDFSGAFSNGEDGMVIDDVRVTASIDSESPMIVSFAPTQGVPGTEVVITGENFGPQTQITFAGVLSEEVQFINSTTVRAVVPVLAQTGKIGAIVGEQRTASQDNFIVPGREVVFFEDWESGQLRSMWTANSSRETGRIEVVGGAPALNGANGLRMGNAVNNQYNVNTLDLSLPLAAYQGRDLVLEYWIYDNFDQSNTDDLIAISDDGGNTFTNIVNWIPGTWVSQQYGKLPPLDLDEAVRAAGMSFTDQFVIRFQQADDDDFNNDGIYLDDILIREESVVYAPPPFSDQFDNEQLSPAWRWINPQGVTATSPTTPGNLVQVFQGAEYVYSETGALAFGRRFETDNVFSVNAADLHLNLQGYTDAELQFWRKRFYDEEGAEDGLWISDDGGASFEKMYAFATEDFPNLTYQEVVIDLDSTLLALGKALTDQVVIRFQQAGSDDFSGAFSNGEDGMVIDDVRVTASIDSESPMIVSFAPTQGVPGTEVVITGENFGPQTQITFAGVLSEEVQFINSTTVRAVVPVLAQTGKIGAIVGEQRTASQDNFIVPGREVVFFEDWESGQLRSMWTANSSRETGRIEVVGGAPALNGANGLRMGNAVNNQYNVNTLDLSLPLAAYQGRDLVLEYWIYDNFDQSNTDDLIAISDDGGNTFTNIVNWIPGTWVSQQYGKLPPLDLDEAVRAAGMSFTDQFVIRFQQADDDDFNNDGIYLDDILIREESVVYAPPPFSDQFDNAQLSPAWRWVNPQGVTATSPTTPGNLVQVFQGAEYVYSETGALAFGRRFETDNVFSVNAADLHLNLQGYTDAELQFWRKRFYDEEGAEDGLWISDDGGASFEKMYAFATEDFPNLTYQEVVIDLDSTLLALGKALTDQVVVRFQQAGSDDFSGAFSGGEDGMVIDDVRVTASIDSESPMIVSFAPTQGVPGTEVVITGENFGPQTQITFAGVLSEEVQFINSTTVRAVVPVLAQTGKIGAIVGEQRTASQDNFIVPGREVVFFEDWESGQLRSMWTANSSRETGRIEVVGGPPALNGANGLRMGNAVNNQYNVNTLDLSLPLAAYEGRDLVLEYWIYDNGDNFDQDDLIAISNDGGETFSNVVNWTPETWVGQRYGKLPPLDLDAAVRAAGLTFTDQFVIRFQQGSEDNFSFDGIFLDDILIREESVVYAPPPFSDQFDNAQLSPAWRWVNPQGVTATSPTTPGNLVQVFQGAEYVYSETGALAFGRRFETDNVFSVNAADLHLNLQGYTDAELRFWRKRFYDEEDAEDGIWISDDGGASFEKMYAFATEDFPNLTYQEVAIDLDSTLLALGKALTDRVVVRFQQAGSDDFSGAFSNGEDGMVIDDVRVSGTQNPDYPAISFLSPNLGPVGTLVDIRGQNLQTTTRVTFNGVDADDFSVISGSTVLATVPPGATTGPVVLTTPIGLATSPGVFQVTEGNDLALLDITSPTSGCDLSNNELVSILIRNTGGLTSDSPITLTLSTSSGISLTEVISPSIAPLEEIIHTFATTINLSANGTYTLSVTLSVIGDEVAENNQLAFSINNFAEPVVTVTGPESICAGDNAQITASGGAGYSWSTGESVATIVVSPAITTEYTVTVSSANGCTTVENYSLAVISPETPVITASNNAVICPGGSVTLTSSVTESVRWSNGVFASSIEVNTAGVYRVTHIEDGCEVTSAPVVVQRATERIIIPDDPTDICAGEAVTLGTSGGEAFSWSTGSTAGQITVSPSFTTTFQVTITENGCTFTDQQIVNVTPVVMPGEVTNLLPENNSVNVSTRPTLSWAPAQGADRYDLYLWAIDQPEPTTPITVSGISYETGPLTVDVKHNWYVVPRNECRSGPPSAIQCFTTASLPDLVVNDVVGPSSAISGTDIVVQWSTLNDGELTTGGQPWKDAAYLSQDQSLDGGDLFLGAVANVTSLPPGIAYISGRTFTLPPCLEGDYYVIVVSDYSSRIAEADEGNNSSVRLIPVPVTLSPKPDLTIDTLRPVGTNGLVGEGEAIEISYSILNVGDAPTGPSFVDRVFLNRAEFDDPNTRIPLGFVNNDEPLEPGNPLENTLSVTLPQGLTGEVYVYVLTDFSDAVEECLFEENNRKRFGPVRIIADPRPDFVADSIIIPDSASTGSRIDVEYTFTNEGIDFSGAVTVAAYLSDSPLFNAIDRISVFSINQDFLTDASVTGIAQISLPGSISGTKYLSLQINPGNSVNEGEFFDERNSVSRTIIINAPDLAVGIPVTEITTVTAGNTVEVNWQVTNQGPGRLINTVVQDVVHLENTNIHRVFEQAITLEVGQSTLRSATLSIPASTPPGEYTVGVRTNANFAVYEEGNFANNAAASPEPLMVTEPSKADLIVATLSGPEGIYLPGANTPVTYTAGNSGDIALAENWRDQLYVTTTPVWNPFSARSVAVRNQSRTLDVGAGYSEDFSVTLPQDLPAGEYYLHLRLDVDNDVFEESNANNGAVTAAFTVNILPPDAIVDLELYDVFSDSIRPGRTISLSYKTRNIGNTITVANGWEDLLVVSTNDTFEPDEDLIIGNWPHNSNLAPGQSYARLETFTLPDILPEGPVRLLLLADGNVATQDMQRANNQRILSLDGDDDGPVIIGPVAQPDLALTINEVLDPAVAGQPLRVAYTVSNVSNDTFATGSWYEGARLGNDEGYTGPEVGRKLREAPLAPGGSYQDTILGQTPNSAEGNFFLTLRTDAGEDVAEIDETNNTASIFLPVIRPLPGDLAVQQILAPATAQANEPFTVEWELSNIGSNPVDGYTEHAVYLSSDEQWDISDVEIGRWRGSVSLGTNSTIRQQTDVCLTNLVEGDYYFVVRADVLDNIIESDDANNEAASVVPISVSIPRLFVDEEEEVSLSLRKPLYYRLEVDLALVGQTVRVSLSSGSAGAVNELFTRFGEVPDRTVFDESYGDAFAADQAIILSDLREGNYYIMAYAAVGPEEQPVSLLAEIVPFAITSINTNVGGNTGPVTAVLTGTRFADGLMVSLEGEGGEMIEAVQVTVQSSVRAFVTFDLLNVPFGTYDVVATSSSTFESSTLTDGFRITTGTSPTAAPTLSCSAGPGSSPLNLGNLGADAGAENVLRLEKIHPAFARRNQVISMTFRYVNEGNIDVVMPRLLITSLGGAPLGLDPMIFNPEILELGMEFQEENGPPNILRPGGIATFSVYTRATDELIFRLY